MPEFKFQYFALNVRGEPIRAMLAHAGVDFEDEHITFEQWPTVKPTIPSGQLPCLEINGKKMGQSFSMSRYLGMKYGYYPEDPMQAYECDMLCDGYNDVLTKMYKPFFVKEEEKKEAMYPEIFDKLLPNYLAVIEPICEKGGWLVGENLTIADFWIGGLYTSYLANEEVGFAKEKW